jgi:allantoinase
MLRHRHRLSPYNGEVFRGVVEKTFVRGRMVYDGGEFLAPLGEIVLRQS